MMNESDNKAQVNPTEKTNFHDARRSTSTSSPGNPNNDNEHFSAEAFHRILNNLSPSFCCGVPKNAPDWHNGNASRMSHAGGIQWVQ